VREAVAAAWTRWLRLLEQEVTTAQAQGELDRELDPGHIAFQLHAYVMAGNWAKQLFGDPDALSASRVAIDRLLAR
jgi:hypothetical protein